MFQNLSMTTDHQHTDLEERIARLENLNALILEAINNLSDRMNLRFDALEQSYRRIEDAQEQDSKRIGRMEQRLEDVARHLGVPNRNGRA